jgi:hypothetical protein
MYMSVTSISAGLGKGKQVEPGSDLSHRTVPVVMATGLGSVR